MIRLNKFGSFLSAALLWASASTALALGGPSYVTTEEQPGSLTLASETQLANLYVDANDDPGVKRALYDLRDDIKRVTGKQPQVVHTKPGLEGHAVIVGTLGQSELLDRLIYEGQFNPSAIRGQWDAYHMEVVNNPLPGIEKALVIAGSNKRGAIYGIYDVSEAIGVSPWYWWADVTPDTEDALYINGDTKIQDAPKVKYRGIFINDEAPALTNWVQENYGDYNHDFYEHVFELILRLKGNFLWPAMWNNAFADDDAQNMILADEYGIVMSTSHHEPMMRADKEWNRYGEGPWEYSTNPENLYDFWLEGAKRNKPYESVYTLGMRGQEDTPMSEGQNIELLEKVVTDQRAILNKVFDRPVEEIPQVWTLYKEVQGFYESGMRVPDDVTLLWADDNWGNIRRLPTPEERDRAGGAGVYYHFDYVGGPRSYRWLNTVPIAKIWEQMNLAYQYQANEIWVVNVGDIKPMEYPTEFFLKMAWDPTKWDRELSAEYGELWAAREFGPAHAEAIAQLMTGYTRHNGRRKPELQSADTYSLLNYREAERINLELIDMEQRAESIYEQLPEAKKAAYYQLVLHPVKASATITRMYIAQARNHLYASQGRANTNLYGELSRDLFARDATLENYFHTELSDGKWNHMMSQPRIGYTHWNNPPVNVAPVVHNYLPHGAADMGVAVEGQAVAWPVPANYVLPGFSPYDGVAGRRIDIYNRGTAPFEFTAQVSDPWIKLSRTEGLVEIQETIDVSIDWDRAPVGEGKGHVFVKGTGWGGARVEVKTFKPDAKTATQVQGFVEVNGYVSMDAASFTDRKTEGGYEWRVIENHGRTGDSISSFPISDESFEDPTQGPYVEYEVFFFSTGEFKVHGLFAPSLDIVPGRGLRYGIAFDDAKPKVVDILADQSSQAWEQAVSDGVRRSTTTHTIKEPGLHKLRIYRVDPAVTLQKIIIDTGGLKPSYLGPPESVRK